eukprot:m.114672 g.114672  ORF g.114672 m.114672 type:complete len:1620 (-) comp14176_c0_seq1:43-4902(-)
MELEGFVCSICKLELESAAALLAHYDIHNKDDEELGKPRRGNRRKRFQPRPARAAPEPDDPSHDHDGTSTAQHKAAVQWVPQGVGITRKRTREFKELWASKKKTAAPDKKTISKLEALLFQGPDANLKKKRKEYEKCVVLWTHNSLAPICSTCGVKFTQFRRRHHCRLCGNVLCKSCSLGLDVDYAVETCELWSGNRNEKLPGEIMTQDVLRVCRFCHGELQVVHKRELHRQRRVAQEKQGPPAIAKVAKSMEDNISAALEIIPTYTVLADALYQLERVEEYKKAEDMKQIILGKCQIVGNESKKCKITNAKAGDKPSSDIYKIRANMAKRGTEFLQKNMVALPKLPKLEAINKALEERKLRPDPSKEITKQPTDDFGSILVDINYDTLATTAQGPLGCIIVLIMRAEHLVTDDKSGLCNPIVACTLTTLEDIENKTVSEYATQKTKIMKRTNDPVFDEELRFDHVGSLDNVASKYISIEVQTAIKKKPPVVGKALIPIGLSVDHGQSVLLPLHGPDEDCVPWSPFSYKQQISLQFQQMDALQRFSIVQSIATGMKFQEAMGLVEQFIKATAVTRGTIEKAENAYKIITGLQDLEQLNPLQRDSLMKQLISGKLDVDQALLMASDLLKKQLLEQHEVKRGGKERDELRDMLRQLEPAQARPIFQAVEAGTMAVQEAMHHVEMFIKMQQDARREEPVDQQPVIQNQGGSSNDDNIPRDPRLAEFHDDSRNPSRESTPTEETETVFLNVKKDEKGFGIWLVGPTKEEEVGKRNGVYIIKLQPGSAAERAGVPVGARIVCLNGYDYWAATKDAVLRALQGSDELELELEVKKGAPRIIESRHATPDTTPLQTPASTPPATRRSSALASPPSHMIRPSDIGCQVNVKHYGEIGILQFVGSSHIDNKRWCGIVFDNAIGDTNGTVDGNFYFKCQDNHGIFVPESFVSLHVAPTQIPEPSQNITSPDSTRTTPSNLQTKIIEPVICERDIGRLVKVLGYDCGGVLQFYGEFHGDGSIRCGVALDKPIGKSNGTVQGVQYFSCPDRCGVMVKPRKITFMDPSSTSDEQTKEHEPEPQPEQIPVSPQEKRKSLELPQSTSAAQMPELKLFMSFQMSQGLIVALDRIKFPTEMASNVNPTLFLALKSNPDEFNGMAQIKRAEETDAIYETPILFNCDPAILERDSLMIEVIDSTTKVFYGQATVPTGAALATRACKIILRQRGDNTIWQSGEQQPTPRLSSSWRNLNAVTKTRVEILKGETGFGMGLAARSDGKPGVVVVKVQTGGPAACVGVKPGVMLHSLNGKNVAEANVVDVMDMLRATNKAVLEYVPAPAGEVKVKRSHRRNVSSGNIESPVTMSSASRPRSASSGQPPVQPIGTSKVSNMQPSPAPERKASSPLANSSSPLSKSPLGYASSSENVSTSPKQARTASTSGFSDDGFSGVAGAAVPSLAGWFLKEPERRGSPNRRFFEAYLDAPPFEIRYFEKAQNGRGIGKVKGSGVLGLQSTIAQRGIGLVIKIESKRWVIMADSEERADVWAEALQATVEDLGSIDEGNPDPRTRASAMQSGAKFDADHKFSRKSIRKDRKSIRKEEKSFKKAQKQARKKGSTAAPTEFQLPSDEENDNDFD